MPTPHTLPQHPVGMQDVTVVMQAAPLSEMLTSLQGRLSNLQQSVLVLAGPRIRDTAAQVLQHASGSPFRSTTSTAFADVGGADAAIQELSKLTNTPAGSIVLGANDVITRGNKHVHFASAEELEAEVKECEVLITANPALSQKHKWECWVITNFAHFKAAFAPAFDT